MNTNKGWFTETHGKWFYNKKTYQCWQDMKQRCYNPKVKNFKNYGGRGIIVCNIWLNSFEQFYKDMGKKPHNMTIERIDNNGNYEASNCKWAEKKDQVRNTRSCVFLELNGERK